jgi:hypothetical protein
MVTPVASSLNKRKYANEEADNFTAMTTMMKVTMVTPAPPHQRRRSLPRRNLPGEPAPMTVTPPTQRTMMTTTATTVTMTTVTTGATTTMTTGSPTATVVVLLYNCSISIV